MPSARSETSSLLSLFDELLPERGDVEDGDPPHLAEAREVGVGAEAPALQGGLLAAQGERGSPPFTRSGGRLALGDRGSAFRQLRG